MRALLTATLLVAGIAPDVAIAQAQTPPARAVTEGAQIESAVRRTGDAIDRAAADPLVANGEGGLYLLIPQSVFFVTGGASIGYQSNPLRSADNPGGSGTADAAIGLGARLKLGGLVDLTASADVAGTKYAREFGPSNTTATGSLAMGLPIGGTPLYVGAVAFGGYNFSEFFGSDVGFYGASGYLSATLPVGRFVVLPQVSVTRQLTRVRENDTTAAAGRLTVATVRGRFTASVSASVSRIWYDDFFEDVTFVPRHDWQYDAGASLIHRLKPNLLLTAALRYVRRDSTFEFAGFDGMEGRAGVGLLMRF